MAQTLVRLLVHLVFSTKNRRNLITPDVEPELFAYMAGVLKNLNGVCLEINGTANHLHTLLSQSKGWNLLIALLNRGRRAKNALCPRLLYLTPSASAPPWYAQFTEVSASACVVMASASGPNNI